MSGAKPWRRKSEASPAFPFLKLKRDERAGFAERHAAASHSSDALPVTRDPQIRGRGLLRQAEARRAANGHDRRAAIEGVGANRGRAQLQVCKCGRAALAEREDARAEDALCTFARQQFQAYCAADVAADREEALRFLVHLDDDVAMCASAVAHL